ncbi:MAG: hypothetical protein HOP03_11880 [Lysobacter sp.]|nr:hypothetical protein [Lysobacter sp.]
MKYDDAEYYFLDFETDLPNENGGRHMGLFLEWAIRRGLANDELMAEADALRSGGTSGLDLLFDHCDGKLLDDDLGVEGNAFAADYYEKHHIHDFIEAMNVKSDASVDEIFGADLTAQRHARVLWQLDRRYSDWRRKFGLMSKEALLERLLVTIQPIAEAAGFPRVAASVWGTHQMNATFERRGAWGHQRFDLIAVDSPEWFHGVRVEFTVHIKGLYEAIVAEKTLDQGSVTSLQDSAAIPFARVAEGWSGPMQDYLLRDAGFWIFREEDIAPLAAWLATRLRTFALPTLRGLDGVDALALAYGTRPMSASPIHDAIDPYAALLSAEQARHPRLGAMLAETEEAIRGIDTSAQTYNQWGALRLIERIRERSKAWL